MRKFWSDEAIQSLRDHLAKGLTDRQTADEMGITQGAVSAMRHRLGIPVNAAALWQGLPMPADFPTCFKEPVRGLISKYHVGRNTIARWRRECGYNYNDERSAIAIKLGRRPPNRNVQNKVWKHWGRQPLNMADGTLAGRASDHLKRWFIPVFKVSAINPKADPDLYRVGRQLLSRDEMITLAEAKGFDPREWARVA